MKFINRLIILLLLVASSIALHAQQQPITSKQYKEAYKLAETAKQQLLAGNIKLADSLIKRSIDIYPTLPVFDYAIVLGSMPDVVGANLIMDRAIDRARTSQGYKDDPMATLAFIKNKNLQKVGTVPYDRERKLYNVLQQAHKVNIILGDRKWIIASMEKIQEPVLKSYGENSKFIDIEMDGQDLIKIRLATYLYHFDEAIKLAEDKPLNNFYTAGLKAQGIQNIKLARYYANPNPENNARVTAILKDVPGKDYAYFAFLVFTGNNQEAHKYYNKVPEAKKNHVSMQFYLALMDITDGNYDAAIPKLKDVLAGYGNFNPEEELELVINKHMLYKAFGDAYSGLKQYNRARDNYKLALLYNPEFKPAIEALTKLDVQLAEASAKDKKPPVITLLEPSLDRSLKAIVAENVVMIKGLANDISGLREVTINGKKVYSQRDGDFWGEVPLIKGANKINILVADMAGNKATKTFTVTQQGTTVIAVNTAIIPVENSPGQNYCVLIAAQNYADSSIPSLDHPIADAIKLKMVLKSSYDFPEKNIITLFNPQTSDFRRQLLELSNIIQPEDNLVIFYAGHGIWVEKEKKGFWLMTDADYKNTKTWLSNKDVLEMIAKLPARHTLLITDACFSGSVFKSRGIPANMPVVIKAMDNKISRVAITSGNDTEVPDESVFMKYLVKALSENKDKYLTAQKMFINKIIEAVMTETKTEPRYGTLELAGHIGGDFIFTHKN